MVLVDVSHEEQGILDLILAHPVSRSGLFWGRFLGYSCAIVIVLAASWLSWLIPMGGEGLGIPWNELLIPYLPLLGALLLFGALALLLSLLLPSARFASALSGGLLVGNYQELVALCHVVRQRIGSIHVIHDYNNLFRLRKTKLVNKHKNKKYFSRRDGSAFADVPCADRVRLAT